MDTSKMRRNLKRTLIILRQEGVTKAQATLRAALYAACYKMSREDVEKVIQVVYG